jgi:hypothetical protein
VQWASFECAQDDHPAALRWRRAAQSLAVDWERTLLVDAPLCPLRTGRQPQASDRVPLEQIS